MGHSGLNDKPLFLIALTVRSLKWVSSGCKQCVGLAVPFWGVKGRISSLAFSSFQSCLHSLALDPLSSSKSTMAGRVFFLSDSDPYSSASFTHVRTLWLHGAHLDIYNPGKSPDVKVSSLKTLIPSGILTHFGHGREDISRFPGLDCGGYYSAHCRCDRQTF